MVKRGADPGPSSSGSGGDAVPADAPVAITTDATQAKKKKDLPFEETYLRSIPAALQYEKSFMHRDVITHIVATQTDFIVTASHDGHVKFWKKKHAEGVEFVKHFRTHLGPILHLAVNHNGTLLATVCGQDKSVKVFDVPNFDMINMLRLDFQPRTAAWVHQGSDVVQALAVSDANAGTIRIFDGKGLATVIHTMDKLHSRSVRCIEYNSVYDVAVSIDDGGMIEYWTGPKGDYKFPTNIAWQFKTDTDLYEFCKVKSVPLAVKISPDGQILATFAADRRIRLFRFATGKIFKEMDETIAHYTDLAKGTNRPFGLPNMEWSRRLAVERDLDRDVDAFRLLTIAFDESSNFLIFPSPLGIKVVNLVTDSLVREIGKPENVRFLGVSLCRAVPSASERLQGAALTMEHEVAENSVIRRFDPDPMLVCCAYRKHRFYLFTNSEPFMSDEKNEEGLTERDVFNEKPLKEDTITAIDSNESEVRITEGAILHTSMGDIHIRFYARECPKTVENFCTHARRGYYNGHSFHRVIKSFMIQTGDPTGKGTGGQSIWGADFADEFHPNIKHDKPYKVSMANAGPNTNGSQFFITVVPADWLDGKNTCFGECTEGFAVVQKINQVSTYEKSGRPKQEINIISITLK